MYECMVVRHVLVQPSQLSCPGSTVLVRGCETAVARSWTQRRRAANHTQGKNVASGHQPRGFLMSAVIHVQATFRVRLVAATFHQPSRLAGQLCRWRNSNPDRHELCRFDRRNPESGRMHTWPTQPPRSSPAASYAASKVCSRPSQWPTSCTSVFPCEPPGRMATVSGNTIVGSITCPR